MRSEKWDHGRFPALVLSRSGSEGAWRAIHTFRTLGPGATLSATVGSPSFVGVSYMVSFPAVNPSVYLTKGKRHF